MSHSLLLDLSALELAALIRDREVRALEVVDAHIARMDAVNPALNAITHRRYEDARADAQAAEALVMAGETAGKPFLGVPITIKETLALTGLPHTAGLVSRRDLMPPEDATTVARMRAAGAIPIAKTNVPELAMWIESANPLFGRTNNPWDVSRTPGGSSGGEAALIAAGASPMGLGTDAAGSIRMPAHLCGVCGHKPTGGLVPGTGHMPPVPGDASLVAVIGPMARRIGDLRAMLQVMAGPDGRDGAVTGATPLRPAPADPRSLKVFTLDLRGLSVTRDVQKAMEEGAAALRDRGISVTPWRAPGVSDGVMLALGALNHSMGPVFRGLLGLEGVGFFALWQRFFTGRLDLAWPMTLVAALEALEPLSRARMTALAAQGLRYQAEVEAHLGADGVLLTPCVGRVASRHGRMHLHLKSAVFGGYTNALHLPGTAVPVGFGEGGMPIALQVLGPRFADLHTLAVAEVLEDALGGWQRADPPGADG